MLKLLYNSKTAKRFTALRHFFAGKITFPYSTSRLQQVLRLTVINGRVINNYFPTNRFLRCLISPRMTSSVDAVHSTRRIAAQFSKLREKYTGKWELRDGIFEDEASHGFDISLATEGNDHFYFSTPYVIQMAVHSPFHDSQSFYKFFHSTLHNFHKMYLRKTIKTLLPPPYPTNCTDYETLWRGRGGYGPLNKRCCIPIDAYLNFG
ncbi:hypothetical protein CEXT_744911 [Caerostris extrusa]|uniref:Uncharacterized protein n=1 Tax=Caerostris extrusa TaxID=172846 RepID=A0AAV4SY92_CAEEX|nr:hypothetical protein CEXT_744911 [Caerostris extrusa]